MEAQIRLDKAEYLSHLVERKRLESQRLGRLAQSLPDAAEKLERLAKALDRSQNYLRVEGAAAGGNEDAAELREAMEERAEIFGRLLERGGNERALSEALAEMRLSAEAVLGVQEECAGLMMLLEEESLREESLRLSEARRGSKRSSRERLLLSLPPPVPEPKLVEF